MISQIQRSPAADTEISIDQNRIAHGIWFATGVVGGFLVPFVFSSWLDLHHDLYYLIYFSIVAVFLTMYVRMNQIDVRRFLRAGIWPSLFIGVPVSLFLIFNVLSRDSTPHPDGAYFAFEIAWRGLVYGVVDGLLLTAFPALVAFGLLGAGLSGLSARLRFAAVVFIFTVIMTGSYHLGYKQFREDGIGQPEIGNVIISLPAMATGNPVGSIVAHGAMHVTAVTHSYETDVFLPPQISAD